MPHHHIVADPGGRHVIAGTHITVEEVLKELATSEAIDAVLKTYPALDRDAIQVALTFAAEKVHGTTQPSMSDMEKLVGDFEPKTPLAKKLWERRRAVIQEAVERGDPLLYSWEEVTQEVRERRGERELGDDK